MKERVPGVDSTPWIAQELQHRLSLLTPADTVRGVFINGVLEVARTLGGDALAQRCLEVTGEEKFVDFFNYSSAAHLRAIYHTGSWLLDRYGDFDSALWQMGHVGTHGFFASPVGKTMRMISGGNPRRLLQSLPRAFSVAGATLVSELRWQGPQSAVFTLKRDFIPTAYTEGVMHAVLEQAKVKHIQVHSHQPQPLVSEYTVDWK